LPTKKNQARRAQQAGSQAPAGECQIRTMSTAVPTASNPALRALTTGTVGSHASERVYMFSSASRVRLYPKKCLSPEV
jgi:hypothetical protein